MNARALRRLLAPRSIALIGGAWADAVAAASRVIGYTGEVWRVHPSRPSSATQHYYRGVDELPAAPDAAFIAAPNHEVPAIAAALARRGAGGFVCFAAGFSETASAEGARLTRELVTNAAELPFLGPNCYGFVNFFDGVALWPDQVVGPRRDRGVALICQSGTIALNLLFNQRSLPIGCVLTVGNQTRLAAEDLIELLCEDERVSAFGLYVEGVRDATRFVHAAARARAAGKPIALVKAGRTDMATRTVRTHTGALAGADAAFDALCARAGIARCESLATLCETLKVFHLGGPLRGRRLLVMGASGGDMAMTADIARHLGLDFAPIPAAAATSLGEILSERVHISNPFDFHTHVWFDYPRQRAMFGVAQRAGFDAIAFMLDCPPAGADASTYVRVIEEFAAALPGAPTRAVLLSSLPESLPSATREQCFADGIVPLQGQREALEALDLAGRVGETWASGRAPLQLRVPRELRGAARTLPEQEAKSALAGFGVTVPRGRVVSAREAAGAADELGFPVVIKALGATLEHKSEVGGVVLDVGSAAGAAAAAQRLSSLSATLLVEEMVTDGVAEILVGITVDPQFGQLLVLGAGGVLAEVLRDSVSLLPPFSAPCIEAALRTLRVWPLLSGYRGRPAADVAALIATILACTRYAAANLERLVELDMNPVIVRPVGRGAVAVDALIRLVEEP
jgi:acyl-CoA synthetase (NDP forming)